MVNIEMLTAFGRAVARFDSGSSALAAARAAFGGNNIKGTSRIDVYRLLLLYKDKNHEAMGKILFGGQSARHIHIAHLQAHGKAQHLPPAKVR